MTVTIKGKCYVYACAECGRLAESERSDTLTCSPACRVKAHRNGRLKSLHAIAKSWDITPALMLRAKAIQELAPEIAREIELGTRDISGDDTQAIVYRKFIDRVMAAARTQP